MKNKILATIFFALSFSFATADGEDTVAPQISSFATTPLSQTLKAGEEISLDFSFTEEIQSGKLNVKAGTYNLCSFDLTNGTTFSKTCEISDSFDLQDKQIYLELLNFQDLSGNLGADFLQDSNLYLDTRAPSLEEPSFKNSFSRNEIKFGESFDFDFSFSEEVKDLSISFQVNGVEICNSTENSEFSFSCSITSEENGQIYAVISAKDSVGNQLKNFVYKSDFILDSKKLELNSVIKKSSREVLLVFDEEISLKNFDKTKLVVSGTSGDFEIKSAAILDSDSLLLTLSSDLIGDSVTVEIFSDSGILDLASNKLLSTSKTTVNTFHDLVRYSSYSDDWVLTEQYFDIGETSLSQSAYKAYKFKVGLFEDGKCTNFSDSFVEYGQNYQGLGRIELVNNNDSQATTWKFKPGKEFEDLENEEEVVFCYGAGEEISSKVRIKKTGKALVIRTVGSGEDKRIFIAKKVGTKGTEVEVSFRCEPDGVATDYDTGENEEKIIVNLKRLSLKTDNKHFGLKVQGAKEDELLETKDTFVKTLSSRVDAVFYFDPSKESTGTGEYHEVAEYLTANPDDLEISLYKGSLSSPEDTHSAELLAKVNGTSLSTSLEVTGGKDNYFSLVTHIKDSSATPTIKVYSVTRYGAEIVNVNTFPGAVAPGSALDFTVSVNSYNSSSEIDFVEIEFLDERFNPSQMRIFNEEVSESSSTGVTSGELQFAGKFIMPADDSLHGAFVKYQVSAVMKDSARTTDGKIRELYLGSKDDICAHPSICVIRGLRALESDEQTYFEKMVVALFTDNPENFNLNDIYNKFKDLKSN